MIILETNAGLANRMRAVASAVTLAREYNTKLTVIWPLNKALNCKFDSLFLPIPENVDFVYTRTPIWRISDKLAKYRYKDVFLRSTLDNSNGIIDRLQAGQDIYVNTFSQFYDVNGYKDFKPIDSILKKVALILPEDTSCLVGVHI